MKAPELQIVGDKLQARQAIVEVDMDGDGVKSVEFGVYANMDKTELAQEVLGKALSSGKIPQALKDLLGLK